MLPLAEIAMTIFNTAGLRKGDAICDKQIKAQSGRRGG